MPISLFFVRGSTLSTAPLTAKQQSEQFFLQSLERNKPKLKEEELFEPVKRLFEQSGYSVNAEVRDCDVTAVRNDELIIIELKTSLSVTLLAQGLKRQRCGADVYVAVPKPKNYSPKKLKDTFYVLKKLELGLIFVTVRGEYSFAEIIFEPKEYKKPAKNTNEILKEIGGRTVDVNVGGVTGRKIATAYTEKCINIACILDKYGPLSPKEIRSHGGDEKCGYILRFNAYGWFEKINKGLYGITKKGRKEVMEYPELEKYYTELLEE